MGRRSLILGNWKMNGNAAALAELVQIGRHPAVGAQVDVGVALPATLLRSAKNLGAVMLGAQDLHPADAGSHTGSISAAMLHEAGAQFALVGHSECRANGDTDDAVAAKVAAAWRHRLHAVVCVGETSAERTEGRGETIVIEQLRAIPRPLAGELTIAYEPVWCIGAASAAETDDITAMMRTIRGELQALFGKHAFAVRCIYGGSADAKEAHRILGIEAVDGLLAGRASLRAETFLPLIDACLHLQGHGLTGNT